MERDIWVMCDRIIPVEIKDNVLKFTITPAMTYVSEH